MKNILKIIFFNIITFLIIVFFLETYARLKHPRLSNNIYSSSKSRGVNTHKYKLDSGFILNRASPLEEFNIDNNKDYFLIIGDSVSQGYGTPLSQIYWERLQNKMNIESNNDILILSLAHEGFTLKDSLETLKEFLNTHRNINVKKIIYQFNYNDITPFHWHKIYSSYNREKSFVKRFEEFKYQYLYKSTFLRLLGKKVSNLKSSKKGSCLAKGNYALGPYTYAFGAKGFEENSIKEWNNFEGNMKELISISNKINANVHVFVSPISFFLPHKEIDPYYNSTKLDFRCSTIDGKTKLKKIINSLKLDLIDPQEYINSQYSDNFYEGNFIPFFFASDSNHPTPHVHGLISEFLFMKIIYE